MKYLVIFLLISSLFVAVPASLNAYGLSCDVPNMKRHFAESDAVFVGHALSKEYVPSKYNFADGKTDAVTEFSVTESFKGISQDTIKVVSSEWFWGINFTQGLDYVVFAYNDGDMLRHQLCTSTGLVEHVDMNEIRHTASELSSYTLGQIDWPQKCYSPVGVGIVHIIDSDMNSHPDTKQSLQIQVWSSIDTDIRNITATETGDDTGVFESTIFFRTTDEASSHRIQVFPGDILYIKYVDTTVPFSDNQEVNGSKTIGQIPPDAFGENWGNVSLDLNVTYLYDACMSEFMDRVGRDDPRLEWIDIEYPSPLQQFKSGVPMADIQCREGLVQIFKNYDDSPACVQYGTGKKLIEREWGTCSDNMSYGRGHPCGPHSSGIVNFDIGSYKISSPKWSDQRIIQNVIDHCNMVGEKTDILLGFKNETHSIDNIDCKWEINSVLIDILDSCKQIKETGSVYSPSLWYDNETHIIGTESCEWRKMHIRDNTGD